MGQEFELKYAAKPEDLQILKNRFPQLSPISMKTIYYDTPDGKLAERKWMLRRRMENDRSVCTLKTPGEGFSRNEWETECDDIRKGVALLVSMGAPAQLQEIAAQGLQESCSAEFTRLAGMLAIEGARIELALDEGALRAGDLILPFTEVEVELKEGREDAVTCFANALSEELGLTIEPRSKVARARALAEGRL